MDIAERIDEACKAAAAYLEAHARADYLPATDTDGRIK